jgi:glycosyltransferase involved in cell wall biosynthesis
MSQAPLVSTVIIFLDAERFLEEALESVFRQSYPHWELLLVDDGSTDESPRIAQAYAHKHPERVRYLTHPGRQNRGMSASRNLGIAQARGRYVAFLDADDVWLPQKLAEQVAILERQPEAAMVYGASLYWYSWSRRPEDQARDYLAQLGVHPNALARPPALFVRALNGEATTPGPSDILVRREVLEHVGGFEESFTGKYQHCEDQALLSKVFLRWPVYVSEACWDRYRIHPDSCSSRVRTEEDEHAIWQYYLEWLVGYLEREKIVDPAVVKALQKALWPYRHPTLRRVLTGSMRMLEGSKQLGRRVLPPALRRRLHRLNKN